MPMNARYARSRISFSAMNSDDYRDLIRSMPCSFCRIEGEGMVSWHHLRHIGLGGTGSKAPAWATIPICNRCHTGGNDNCHNYRGIYTRETQKRRLLVTWIYVKAMCSGFAESRKLSKTLANIDADSLSNKQWRELGEAYYNSLK